MIEICIDGPFYVLSVLYCIGKENELERNLSVIFVNSRALEGSRVVSAWGNRRMADS